MTLSTHAEPPVTRSPMQAQYVSLDERLAYVERSGSGPSLLLLHTAGQSGVQYRYAVEPLARAGYDVIVPDLPGHGRSEPSRSGPVTDLSDYAGWLVDLLDELGVDRFYVAGCSIGGKIALDLAVRLGDRVAGAVAMAADAKNDTLSERGLRRQLEDAAAPSRSDRTYFGTLAVIGQHLPAQQRELIATMHRREDPAVSTCDLIGWSTHDLRAHLDRVTAPVNLVAGDADLWISLDQVRWAADQIPRATFTVLEGIGHYPMEEMAEFPETLDAWLRGLAGA